MSRKKKRLARPVAVVAASLATLALAACDGSEDPTGPSTTSTSSGTSTTSTGTGTSSTSTSSGTSSSSTVSTSSTTT